MAIKLTLDDLKPKEATFTLPSWNETQPLTLRKFSLNARIWAKQTIGEKFHVELTQQNIEVSAKLAYHLLKEKELFPKEEDFFEAICSPIDQYNMVCAVAETLGVDKKLMEQIAKSEENPPVPQTEIASESSPTGEVTTTV